MQPTENVNNFGGMHNKTIVLVVLGLFLSFEQSASFTTISISSRTIIKSAKVNKPIYSPSETKFNHNMKLFNLPLQRFQRSLRTQFNYKKNNRLFHSSALSSSSLSALSNETYDVIVIGGGHAGCEACTASARTGAKTALVTQNLETIGELSCNPSIGGIGKGHLVREIDALDGAMGDVADMAGIHFRMLNRRKGPAVRGPRGQMDRDLYRDAMQHKLKNEYGPNLDLVEGSVEDLLLDEGEGIESLTPFLDPTEDLTLLSTLDDKGSGSKKEGALASSGANDQHRKARIRGVVIKNKDGTTSEILAKCVVITTGTFLRGVLMMGKERYSGGRHLRDSEEVEPPSVGLANTLNRFGFPLGRLKTGTPPRLDGDTINWDACTIQPSENPASPFSHIRQFLGEQPPNIVKNTLINCYKSNTNEATHKLVMDYAHLLPEYDGKDGKGNGPRYCPSIYKKVERFPDRTGHNSFLEPEGLNTNIVYPNGMSGPYPPEIQLKIMRTMRGLENVDIVRPGYDVEYDFVNPQSLTHTLETKTISGLFLAGQICGTTGYEEAGAQGIVAGANAGRAAVAASVNDAAVPFILGRDEGYIGVLIDDLVTRGTQEPYRMFTSRAEYRISLRADNADLRLTRKGVEHGLVRDEERIAAVEAREMLVEDRVNDLKNFKLFVTEWAEKGDDTMGGDAMNRKGREGHKKSAEQILGMPHVTLSSVEKVIHDVQTEERQKALVAAELEAAAEDTEIPNVMEPSTASIYDTVEATIKYKSYVTRQNKDMESWRKSQGVRIPPDIIYDHALLPTLSKEELEKLSTIRPATFAEASQISGITPQSLVFLYHQVTKRNKGRDNKRAEALSN
jgi:tRNA uridine 5-carboxymethylaminomethyl modification enzyme